MFGADQIPAGIEDVFLRQGPLGAALIAVAALAWWLIRREATRADAAQAQVNDLNARIRDDLLPAVLRAQEAHTAVTQLLVRVGELLPDVASALRDYDRDRGRR